MSAITLKQAETEAEVTTARNIFREYEAWLGLDLCFQGFEDELKNLPGKYSPPRGRLYLATSLSSRSSTAMPVEDRQLNSDDTEIAGCIALRPLGADVCEMKRLFVRDKFRGMRIGKLLIERLIDDAKEIGYETKRLDTFPPKMGKAAQLYESYGFREIAPYYDNPNDGVLFMELDLRS